MNDYQDIINLPRYISKTRKPMSLSDRACQFAPFSALTGYEEKIDETARLTDKKLELDDYEKEKINANLYILKDNLKNFPVVKVTYFVKDEKKQGGKYVTIINGVKKIDRYLKRIVFLDDTQINIEDIYDLQGELFD